MFDLPIDKAKIKKVGAHKYYIFPKPLTHTNQRARPTAYADAATIHDEKNIYKGIGSNGVALLLPAVHSAANAMMAAMRRVGDRIDDWSLKSAVIQNGFRPDDAGQGATYLRIIKQTIREKPDIFGDTEFPANLETEAQSVLGRFGDSRREAFHRRLAAAPGWDGQLVSTLFNIVDNVYAPRGANPHATGLVFDLDFSIATDAGETQLGADAHLNNAALSSAAGRWLNQYSMMFGFDSYDTSKEIWHQEFRAPKEGPGSPDAITLLNCCGGGLELADEAVTYSQQAISAALKRFFVATPVPVAKPVLPKPRR